MHAVTHWPLFGHLSSQFTLSPLALQLLLMQRSVNRRDQSTAPHTFWSPLTSPLKVLLPTTTSYAAIFASVHLLHFMAQRSHKASKKTAIRCQNSGRIATMFSSNPTSLIFYVTPPKAPLHFSFLSVTFGTKNQVHFPQKHKKHDDQNACQYRLMPQPSTHTLQSSQYYWPRVDPHQKKKSFLLIEPSQTSAPISSNPWTAHHREYWLSHTRGP